MGNIAIQKFHEVPGRPESRLQAGRPGFNTTQSQEISLLATRSRWALEPIQSPIQRVPGALSAGLKRTGRGAYHSPPPNTKVKKDWRYNSTPSYIFMTWCLINTEDNFWAFLSFRTTRQLF
jgi:hypothetical protein